MKVAELRIGNLVTHESINLFRVDEIRQSNEGCVIRIIRFFWGILIAFTSGLNAKTGCYHMNFIWAKVRWTDDTGSHLLESNKAYCN